MMNVRNSSDALAQPVAADSDSSKFHMYHSTFPMPLPDKPSWMTQVKRAILS